MKKNIFILLLLIFTSVNAQVQGKIEVDWTGLKDYYYGDIKKNIPHFNSSNYEYNSDANTLLFSKIIESNMWVDEKSVVISNLVKNSVSESELGHLNKNNINNELQITIQNVEEREKIKTFFQFNPIIKTATGFEKIISFDYSISAKSNSNRNSQSPNSIVNSVLNTGKWHRFYVEKSGVFIITKSFLKSIGFNTDQLDPRKIKIYGNGGRMLPIENADFYPMDLTENAIEVFGETDGVFNDNDYILMYAEGMDNWSQENYTHLNLYADKSYYYVVYDGTNGKRISPFTQPTAPATVTTSQFDGYSFHETDKKNLASLGRVWFGEEFSITTDQEFTFSIPNIVPASTATIETHLGDATFVNTKFKIAVNGGATADVNMNHSSGGNVIEYVQNTFISNYPSSTNFTVKIIYDNAGVPTAKGYLDFITIKSKNLLTGFGAQYRFQNTSITTPGIIEYQFSNATNLKKVWNITDIYNVSSVIDNNSLASFSFKDVIDTSSRYIAVDMNNLYEPAKDSVTEIANQDLKGTIFYDSNGTFADIDYLIVTPTSLVAPAEKLANFHRNYSSLNVKVVSLDKIYQEFGGGKQDIGAIRNFAKYVYENASSPQNRVKYLNLFGDASFDFKNRIRNNTNIVPIFHTSRSYVDDGISSFATDDYFGMVTATDVNPELNINGIDIAVGRMIVSSESQAYEMVNKIIEYHDIKSYGNWRNNYTCIADDPDSFKVGDVELQYYQNSLTDVIYSQKPFFNYKKILLDLYQQETTSGGARYPKAKVDIQNAFEKGSLVFNYLGHGGEDGLTQERIWDKFDGANFNNQFKYPLFITLTCEFSRFDNPLRPTAGEYTYWNPTGGAIAMITTTRKIGQGDAQSFNITLAQHLFSYGSNTYNSIAESLRIAKNNTGSSGGKRVISFLGDPALKLAIPSQKVVLTKVNDVSILQPIDDLKALSNIKLSGEVQDEFGNLLNNYTGELFVNIFDKSYVKQTLRNDGVDALIALPNVTAPYLPVNTLGETIFRGNASITNGKFEFNFVVPKDIKIPLGNGRISFYSKRNQSLLDKTGYNMDIKVGGINTNAVADTTPPTVQLYMNDETFVTGGITNQSPYFLVKLQDQHGINTASGIGHDLVAILDGDENNPYILNDYYETELNDFTKGKIRFPFRNLSLGLHTIIFRGWDVYNNLVTAEIQFIVVGDGDVSLTNVLNYPNPFVNYTQFWFSHNKPYETLEVQVQIITITGKIVKTINQTVVNEGFTSREISWNGLDDFGDRIGKGVYVYKLTVKSTSTGKKSEKIEKLVIL